MVLLPSIQVITLGSVCCLSRWYYYGFVCRLSSQSSVYPPLDAYVVSDNSVLLVKCTCVWLWVAWLKTNLLNRSSLCSLSWLWPNCWPVWLQIERFEVQSPQGVNFLSAGSYWTLKIVLTTSMLSRKITGIVKIFPACIGSALGIN